MKTEAPPSNAKRLRDLMTSDGLTYAKVAELGDVAVKTVEGWLASSGSASHRQMPDQALALIMVRATQRRRKAARSAARKGV